MKVTSRSTRAKGKGMGRPMGQCSNKGCIHSASFVLILLGTEHVKVCSKCKKAMVDAYDHALFGWPDEVRAERDRELAAA